MNPYGHWIKNVSYKGLKIELAEPDFIHPRIPGGFALILTGWVPDRNNIYNIVKVMSRWESFYDLEEDEFYRYIHRAIREFELHELDEFFLVKGKRIYDPHKDEKSV